LKQIVPHASAISNITLNQPIMSCLPELALVSALTPAHTVTSCLPYSVVTACDQVVGKNKLQIPKHNIENVKAFVPKQDKVAQPLYAKIAAGNGQANMLCARMYPADVADLYSS